ncbi:MAG: HipA domain-containing protein [Polyangiales bacterium]
MSLLLLLDSAKASRAKVFRDAEPAGTLERTARGASFRYGQDFLNRHGRASHGIAYHLPLRDEPFIVEGSNLHPFFAGLLPEGLRLEALVRHVKTSRDDLMSQLLASGPDTVGDVWLTPEGTRPPAPATVAQVADIGQVSFENLWSRSVDYASDALREQMSVPGVHRKISASMISFPVRGVQTKTIHILKLGSRQFPRLVRNEFFFMNMARECGVPSAKVELVRDADGETGLLVERFDRVSRSSGEPTKVHQEDACQFLDRYPWDKYLLSLADVARGLSICHTPILAVSALLRLQAFSYLIGNGDLHGKNISLRTNPDKGWIEPTLAYDLLSTWPYGDRHMALKVDGRDARLTGKAFVRFGERFGVTAKATRTMLDKLCTNSGAWVPRTDEIGLNKKKTDSLKRMIQERRSELARV